MDWGGANSRFLGLVSVWAARSFDQTALRPSVIKRIRQIDVKYISQASVSLREHACVSSRGAQSTELVSLYIGYWTLNNYYYYYYYYYITVHEFKVDYVNDRTLKWSYFLNIVIR